jgi:hypothetical protein
MRTYRGQTVSTPEALDYDGEKIAKSWESLKAMSGRRVPVVDGHPDGDLPFLTGCERIYGYATLRANENKQVLEADIELEDDAPNRRGFSIAYLAEVEGNVAEIISVNHLAITDDPRNPSAVLAGAESNGRPPVRILLDGTQPMTQEETTTPPNEAPATQPLADSSDAVAKIMARLDAIEARFSAPPKTQVAAGDSAEVTRLNAEIQTLRDSIKTQEERELRSYIDALVGFGAAEAELKRLSLAELRGANWWALKVNDAVPAGKTTAAADADQFVPLSDPIPTIYDPTTGTLRRRLKSEGGTYRI